MSTKHMATANLSSSFGSVSKGRPQREPTPETKPFCIRLTEEERVHLEHLAGKLPLGRWARKQLLGTKARKRRKRTRLRQPKTSDKNLALVMALLGDQRIASNLNQLAKHANMGTLDCDDYILEQIQEACAAMIAIRNYLISE